MKRYISASGSKYGPLNRYIDKDLWVKIFDGGRDKYIKPDGVMYSMNTGNRHYSGHIIDTQDLDSFGYDPQQVARYLSEQLRYSGAMTQGFSALKPLGEFTDDELSDELSQRYDISINL